MPKANEHHEEDVVADSKDRFSSDLETLKSTLSQLREDMTKLLDNTLGTGKSGAGMIKDRASAAVLELEDRGVEQVEKFGRKIGERPLLSAAIALGIGFVLAKLFTRKR